MSTAPVVRPFRAEEWRVYRDLRLRALADSPEAFARTLEEEEAYDDAFWEERLAAGVEGAIALPLVAEVGGAPAGLAWGRGDEADPEKAYVFQMWVDPAMRGAGAGQLLLDRIVAWARERGARCVQLGVTVGNTTATRLYARSGFVPVLGRDPLRPGSATLTQTMRRLLDVTVRLLGPGDAAVLDRVAEDVFDETIRPELTREFLADPRHHIAVAIEDGTVVGFASGFHYVHPDKPAAMFVNEVGVAPSHHRRGIGTLLMGAILDRARTIGCKGAWVGTEVENIAARGLYLTAGGEESSHPFVEFDYELDDGEER